ncbi:MAG: hypothetical protein HFG33_01195 [Bacilli bacterium]|nr:hypothetical protein [Bacilli bacterium]
MKKIAHRGYKTKMIKENTDEAFKNAIANEFEGFECDVHMTKDKELVIIHDSFIDRVSDGSGLVRDMNLNELFSYNFGSTEVPSRIPLLKDVLSNYRDVIKVIELKGDIDIESVKELIDSNTYFISFDTSYMKKMKKKYPKFKFGILNYVLNSVDHYDLDHVCLLDSLATDEIVMSLLKRGITVFIYGVFGDINYKRDYKNLYYIVNKRN